MTVKTVAFLGASLAQTPILLEAKRRGVYCITIDNVPSNPGHSIGDRYLNVSTTDRVGVLLAVRGEQLDGIISYASDVAVTTASWVADQLGLPSNSLASVSRLTDKEHFRIALRELGLPAPASITATVDDPWIKLREALPVTSGEVIIKPSDSAGTKGVSVTAIEEITVRSALVEAHHYSMSGKLVIEQLIDNAGGDVHGDGFVVDGHLEFLHLGDHLYDPHVSTVNPVGTTWPTMLDERRRQRVHDATQHVISHVGFTNGAINVEARFDVDDVLHLMEIGPRSGGYFTPLAIRESTGVDLVSATVDQLLGKPVRLPTERKSLPVAYYAVHARRDGLLGEVRCSDWLSERVVLDEAIRKVGEPVEAFLHSGRAIGVLLIRFESCDEMRDFAENIDDHIRVEVQ